MKEIALVFVGGGLGSIVRYVLGKWINTFHQLQFPWGTLVVNVTACIVLGVVIGLADHKQILSASSRLFWAVGFCGGFSTFSTFSHETLSLLQGGATFSAISYVVLSVVLCVLAVVGGLYAGQHIG